MRLHGSMVALITPMHQDGQIDYKSFNELIDWHIESGTSAIIINGTTGESATLTPDEQINIINKAVKKAAGRVPIVAGTGTNATSKTCEMTQKAKDAGADACLIVTPYYNKPTQEGLYQHYRTIADSVDIPIILYNVPGRTACDLQAETVARLSSIPNIIGIKEATGKVERVVDIRNRCGNDFGIYSGDDATGMEAMLQGADGVISVTANICPEKMARLCKEAIAKNRDSAEAINHELDPLHHNLFVEANPIPVKWALHVMEKTDSGIRLPLLPLDKKYHQQLKDAIQHAGIKIGVEAT